MEKTEPWGFDIKAGVVSHYCFAYVFSNGKLILSLSFRVALKARIEKLTGQSLASDVTKICKKSLIESMRPSAFAEGDNLIQYT
jgi:hypothetical protein